VHFLLSAGNIVCGQKPMAPRESNQGDRPWFKGLVSRTLANDFTRTFVVYAAARAVPSLGTLIFTFISLQNLSAIEYGKYSLALLPAIIGGAMVGGFAGQPMLRFGASMSRVESRRGLVLLPLLGSLLVIPAVWLELMRSAEWPCALLAVSLVPLLGVFTTSRSLLISLTQPNKVFILDSTRSVGSCLLLIMLLWSGFDRVLSPLVAMVGATAGALLLINLPEADRRPAGGARIDRGYLTYGFWVAGWMTITALLPYLERSFIERLLGIEEAGIYAKISDPIYAFLSAATAILVSVLFPRLVDAWNANEQGRIARLIRYGLAGGAGTALFVTAVGAAVVYFDLGRISAVIGENESVGIVVLVATTVWQLGIFVHKPLELSKRVASMFFCLMAALGVFLISVKFLLPAFGIIGMASAKLVAGLFYLGLTAYVVRRFRERVCHA
jgi:hypothetical protein